MGDVKKSTTVTMVNVIGKKEGGRGKIKGKKGNS